MVSVADRIQETLLGIKEDKVEKGSTIYTDCFASYNTLKELGYKHATVNHSENCVVPDTGVCTSKIESTWWALKRSLPSSHTRPEYFGSHLGEYMWLRKNRKKNNKYLFSRVLEDRAKVYPGADA